MFKIGDIVEITEESSATGMLDFKTGEGYEVIHTANKGRSVFIRDESGRTYWYFYTHFKLKEDTKVEKKECLFKEGQVVWDVVYGKGVVVEIAEYSTYPVIARFSDETMDYTVDGKTYEMHGRTLFFSEPKIEAATEPVFEPTLKRGDVVVVLGKGNYGERVVVQVELEDRILDSDGTSYYKSEFNIFYLGEIVNFK